MADGIVKIDIVGDDSDIKKKIDDTEEGLDGLGKKQKETQKETEKTTTKFDELANSIDKQEKELRDLKGAYTEAIINFGKGSTEAKELEGKISDLNSELSKNKKAFTEAENEAEKLTGALDENEKSSMAADVAIGNLAAQGLSALISKVGEAISAIMALATETREYREDMAKLDAAFTTAGHSTETASQAYDSFYRILGESDRSVEAVNHLAELTDNEKEIAKWSTIAAGVTAKFGDSLPIEGLTEAANETAKVGKVTGPLADALNWAGISEDEFNAKLEACNSEQERATLITDTLNSEYSAAADEYNKLTAETQAARDATNKMEKAQAAMGKAVEPVTTAWTELKAKGLQAIQPVIEAVAGKLSELIGWLQEHPAILNMVVGALGALAIALGIITVATIAQTVAQWAQNAAWLACPITWIILAIVAVIGALVGAFMWLWDNSEGFRNFFTGLWEGIKNVVSTVVDAIVGFFKALWEDIKSDWNAVVSFFTAIWNGIKNVFSTVVDWFVNIFSSAWEGIKSVWNAVVDFFKGIWDGIVNIYVSVNTWFIELFLSAWEGIKNIWNTVVDFFKGIWEGIKNIYVSVNTWFIELFLSAWNGIKNIWNAVVGFFKGIWDGIKNIYVSVNTWFIELFLSAWNGIKSVWNTVVDFFKGIWDGIKNVFSSVGSWFKDIFSSAWNGIKNVFSNVKEFFSGILDKIVGVFSNIGSKFLEVGSNIVSGIWDGISNGFTWIKDKITGWVGDVLDFFKDLLGIESPSKVFRDEIGKYISEGIAVGIEKNADKPKKALGVVFASMKKILKSQEKDTVDTIRENNKEKLTAHKEYKEKYAELTKKAAEDRKKAIADGKDVAKNVKEITKQYNEDVLNLKKELSDKIKKADDNSKSAIEAKMKESVNLQEKYKDDVKKLWADLTKSIEDAWDNYREQVKSKTESIANSLNLWDAATKNVTSSATLKRNLQSQVSMLDAYNKAITKLEGKTENADFINYIKGMGVDSTGEIQALVKMTERELNSYVALWEKKNELARQAALEELEPLKEETKDKVMEMTNEALDQYATLRAEYNKESALIMEEMKQAMIETGWEGYNTLISQIDNYTEAGEDLMKGVVVGVANKSPEVANAIKTAVRRAINAAKMEAGIASPSKVMKKEVGYNLAEGVAVGWSEKLGNLKDKMSAEMSNITARIKTAVSLENARISQGVGVRDTGFTEVAQAVGMQTAGINSLASEYRKGSTAQVTVPLVLDGRELGRAIVDLGNTETVRTGTRLSFA